MNIWKKTPSLACFKEQKKGQVAGERGRWYKLSFVRGDRGQVMQDLVDHSHVQTSFCRKACRWARDNIGGFSRGLGRTGPRAHSWKYTSGQGAWPKAFPLANQRLWAGLEASRRSVTFPAHLLQVFLQGCLIPQSQVSHLPHS